MLNRAIVVLGAGASFDCGNAGSSINPTWRPPLAAEFFDMTLRPDFQPTLRQFEGAAFLGSRLARAPAFEQALSEMRDHRDPRIQRLFQDIPPYLGSIIRIASTNYTHVPGAYVELVIGLIADTDHEVLVITLNYDDLCEQALNLFDHSLTFTDQASYVQPDRSINVVKLHGSATWFRRCLSGDEGAAIISSEAPVICVGPRNSLPFPMYSLIAATPNPNAEFVYPVLTAPVVSKGCDDITCPNAHAGTIAQFGSNDYKLLIIGCSCRDADLLELLAPINERCRYLNVVDVEPEAVGARIEGPLKHSGGLIKAPFSGYVRSQQFLEFLRF